MSSKKILIFVAAIMILILIGLVFFIFQGSILGMFGISNNTPTNSLDTRGTNITFNAGSRSVAIPPKLSDDFLTYLKQELTGNEGLPVKVEKRGNSLPFGIP